MTNEYTIVEKKFKHIIVEGSSYEIGQKIAEILEKNKDYYSFYTSGDFEPKKLGFESFEEIKQLYEVSCPGITDEIQGYTDHLGVSENKAVIYGMPFTFWNNCSHMLALPPITRNKEVLAGTSYEWNYKEDDFILFTTRIKGKLNHISFCNLLFGRYEGLNSGGLCITSSGGGAYGAPMKNRKGIFFTLAIRSLLENCQSVKSAVDWVQNLQIISTGHLILSDKTGEAVKLTYMDGQYYIQELSTDSQENYAVTTNHYTLKGTEAYNSYVNKWLLSNSNTRLDTIKSAFEEVIPDVSEDTIKSIMAKEIPDGICAHWHSACFGTLWSMLFNVTKEETKVCFGPPTHNTWHKFSLKSPEGVNEYTAKYPEKFL